MLCNLVLAIMEICLFEDYLPNCPCDKEGLMYIKISDTRVLSIEDVSELRKDSLKTKLLEDDENPDLQIRTADQLTLLKRM